MISLLVNPHSLLENKMNKITIGAGYGDEGKGLMTDYLSGPNTTVVRHNGGAQAGHTVVTPEGYRHVFHHIGSGTFRGAETYLSRHFVANPIIFRREYTSLPMSPRVTLHPDCPVTTPYDMMVNQAREMARGVSRHGSCGLGFGETIARQATISLRVGELANDISSTLEAIRQYCAEEISHLGIDLPVWDPGIFEAFMADCAFMTHFPTADHSYLSGRELVFEGAQGLMLDMDHRHFPHVTRSKTGIHNATSILREIGQTSAEVHYVTRAYKTRHGAGPLAGEEPMPNWVIDPTNHPNDWQGSLRYGRLDVEELMNEINRDMEESNGITLSPSLTVTCMDQVPDRTILQSIREVWPHGILTSYGPTRNDVRV